MASGNYVSASIPVPDWKILRGKPYVTVSAKGISNGLSNIPNDGADFGPDTPGTTSMGIYEAINFAVLNGTLINTTAIVAKKIYILEGKYIITQAQPTITSPYLVVGLSIEGASNSSSSIIADYTGGYTFVFDPTAFAQCSFNITNLNIAAGASAPDGFFYISTTSQAVTWISYYLQIFVGWANNGYGIYLNGFYCAYFYENQLATGGNTLYCANGRTVGLFGGSNYGVSLNSLLNLFSYSSTIMGNISSISYSLVMVGGAVYIGSFSGAFGSVFIAGIITAGAAPILILSGNTTIKNLIIDGVYEKNGTNTINFTLIYNPSSYSLTIDNLSVKGVITDSGNISLGYTLSPTISANPPASATVYQNTNPYDIRIYLPAYATTSGTAGSVAIALGSTSSPPTIGTKYINGSTSSSATEIIELVVPAGWYYEFTSTGVTFGTATVLPA